VSPPFSGLKTKQSKKQHETGSKADHVTLIREPRRTSRRQERSDFDLALSRSGCAEGGTVRVEINFLFTFSKVELEIGYSLNVYIFLLCCLPLSLEYSLDLKMEVVLSSETSLNLNQITSGLIPEDGSHYSSTYLDFQYIKSVS
jgi:hypothetical protein